MLEWFINENKEQIDSLDIGEVTNILNLISIQVDNESILEQIIDNQEFKDFFEDEPELISYYNEFCQRRPTLISELKKERYISDSDLKKLCTKI